MFYVLCYVLCFILVHHSRTIFCSIFKIPLGLSDVYIHALYTTHTMETHSYSSSHLTLFTIRICVSCVYIGLLVFLLHKSGYIFLSLYCGVMLKIMIIGWFTGANQFDQLDQFDQFDQWLVPGNIADFTCG